MRWCIMISYREKQLLMVMKMLQDDTTELSLQLTNAINETQQRNSLTGNISYLPEPIADFDTLVEMAEDKGYDMYIRASDILTEEELRDIEQRKDEIDQKFKAITKLHGVDYAFLLAAIALQIARQAVQPRLDFESLDVNKRENDKKRRIKQIKHKQETRLIRPNMKQKNTILIKKKVRSTTMRQWQT